MPRHVSKVEVLDSVLNLAVVAANDHENLRLDFALPADQHTREPTLSFAHLDVWLAEPLVLLRVKDLYGVYALRGTVLTSKNEKTRNFWLSLIQFKTRDVH